MMPNSEPVQHPGYLRVALQSAFAAALFLGFPAGLSLWLVLFRESTHVAAFGAFMQWLQANGLNKIVVLVICSVGWSYLLGRISGYRARWKIGLATALGILAGWFSPLSNLDGWFGDGLPIHALYALTMSGLVASVTICVSLAYGLLLRNTRAALTMALTTGLVSVLSLLLVIFIFDRFGIRVGGEVPFAMSKVTTMSLLMSAVAGGAVLGAMFKWFVERNTK